MADLLTFLQTVIYGCLFILGFLISIPVGVTQDKFEGHCILYGKPVGWIKKTNATCDFSIAFSVIALIVYCLLCAVYHGYCFWRSRSDKSARQNIWNIPFLALNAVTTIILLVMACILSVGYSSFCNEFKDPHTCKSAQDTWVWTYNGEKIDPGKYHDRMTLAIASSWIAFVIFLVQVGLGILRIRRKRSWKQSKSQEAKYSRMKIPWRRRRRMKISWRRRRRMKRRAP